MQTPQELVKSFIKNYFDWAVMASKASEGDNWNNVVVMDSIENDYVESIIRIYCEPQFKGEKIAFSSEPFHCPSNEIIISDEINGESAVVITKHTLNSGFSMDFEYSFSLKNDRWYLNQVYYLSEGEMYPSL